MKRIIAMLLFIIGVLLFLLRSCNNEPKVLPGSGATPTPNLPENVAKRVEINTAKRRLRVVTPNNPEQSLFLPPHATIDILKDGTFKVTAKPFGFAVTPFMGVGYQESLRYYAGAHLMYFKYLDFGLYVSGGKSVDVRIGAEASWNVWRSLDLGFGYDNKQHVNVLASLKF